MRRQQKEVTKSCRRPFLSEPEAQRSDNWESKQTVNGLCLAGDLECELLAFTLRLPTDSRQVLRIGSKFFWYSAVVDIQTDLPGRDQSQIGQDLEMMRQGRRGNRVLGMDFAAEQFIMLRNLRVNGETIRIA